MAAPPLHHRGLQRTPYQFEIFNGIHLAQLCSSRVRERERRSNRLGPGDSPCVTDRDPPRCDFPRGRSTRDARSSLTRRRTLPRRHAAMPSRDSAHSLRMCRCSSPNKGKRNFDTIVIDAADAVSQSLPRPLSRYSVASSCVHVLISPCPSAPTSLLLADLIRLHLYLTSDRRKQEVFFFPRISRINIIHPPDK